MMKMNGDNTAKHDGYERGQRGEMLHVSNGTYRTNCDPLDPNNMLHQECI